MPQQVHELKRVGMMLMLAFVLLHSAACGSDPVGSVGQLSSASTDTLGVTTSSTRPQTSTTSLPGTTRAEGSTQDSASEGTGIPFDIGNIDTGGLAPVFNCANIASFETTSVGCVFWSTSWSADPQWGIGIGIGNPSQQPATVVLERRGPLGLELVGVEVLAPQESKLMNINGPGGLLPNTNVNVSPGYNANAAYRLTSDVPITAMQVAPLGGGPSHISEASLLLPQNALALSHFAVGYADLLEDGGRVAVVATENGTLVTTPAGDTVLDIFDVQVYSMDDATGFFVGSSAPVAVFSGTECSYIPPESGACDHLEEQVVPAASWGTTYVGARHPMRPTSSNDTPELVYWRVLTGTENTTITLTPPVAGASINLANPGDFTTFTTAENFVAESDDPFMLVQYMAGCTTVTQVPLDPKNPCFEQATGDPYMIQMPPVEQWLDALPFLTDTSYPRDFVVFMREAGTTVQLACLGNVDASHFTAIEGTNYEVGVVELDASSGEGDCEDGAQFVTADGPIGVIVGGMDWATSYGYAGGLGFTELWVPPGTPQG